MPVIKIESYAAKEEHGGFQVVLALGGCAMPSETIETNDLGDIRNAVHRMMCRLRDAGRMPAAVSTSIMSGRAPRGYRAWAAVTPFHKVLASEERTA
ncbi:hypothetical protein [uncultured Jannaschia sp.]|uniref:hypothetical protein n=1 Tax=uncultured Jannaschia sp. TaxID=293347 RepID=UPI00260D8AB4|nr:hypothetical protein [uncultured Jannaschia sp.]